MSETLALQSTLVSQLWPVRGDNRLTRAVLLVVAGGVLLALSARAQIPFYPVPMTLQTLVVLMLGAAYGSRLGAVTVAAYLAAGAAGLPVFAGTPEKGLGLAYVLGPTGGYLVGFALAAFACGALAERGWGRHLWSAALAMLAGNVLIYLCGLVWLGSVAGWDKPILQWGLYPFLIGDLVKIAAGTALLPLAWRLVGHRPGH